MYLCVVRWADSRALLICVFADISGVPGTGKTATVHAVVRELKRMAEQNVRPLYFRFDTAHVYA